jgi:hypothetical protein
MQSGIAYIMSEKAEKIEKEKIENLRFPADEVLSVAEEKNNRLLDLKRALTLGNLEKGKVKIYFRDESSNFYVETTVWGLTDKRVILKYGIVIPIHRVFKVEF